jgi:uncharacterized membrane protein YqjE
MEKIKDKILKFLHLDTLIGNVTGYVEARVALVKIEIREEVAGILSRGLLLMLIFMVGFLCLLFATFGLAQYLNAILESTYAGYVIVALFFGLVLLILLISRKSFFRILEKQFTEMIKQRNS